MFLVQLSTYYSIQSIHSSGHGKGEGDEAVDTLLALLWKFPVSGNPALARTQSRRVMLGSHGPRTARGSEANKVSLRSPSAAIRVWSVPPLHQGRFTDLSVRKVVSIQFFNLLLRLLPA